MPRSMTGFGEAAADLGGTRYTVEIRSVNSRYFKAVVRLPEIWNDLEADVERRLRDRLHRGSVYCVVRMKGVTAESAYEVNVPALERYIEQIEIVRPDQTDVQVSIDLASLLQLPGVCAPREGQEFREKTRAVLASAVDEAIEALLAMRAEEGKALAADLVRNCDVISGHLAHVAARAPQVVEDYQERLARRVEELSAGAEVELDEQSLAREVALFAERCDIAEEVSRLSGHLEQFRSALAGEDQPGRKLDFIAQEMLREANTIAAKANDGDIIRRVVEVKTAVDRIKEQLQNLE